MDTTIKALWYVVALIVALVLGSIINIVGLPYFTIFIIVGIMALLVFRGETTGGGLFMGLDMVVTLFLLACLAVMTVMASAGYLFTSVLRNILPIQ